MEVVGRGRRTHKRTASCGYLCAPLILLLSNTRTRARTHALACAHAHHLRALTQAHTRARTHARTQWGGKARVGGVCARGRNFGWPTLTESAPLCFTACLRACISVRVCSCGAPGSARVCVREGGCVWARGARAHLRALEPARRARVDLRCGRALEPARRARVDLRCAV